MEKDYVPYFVVYCYSDEPDFLCCSFFMTLFELYSFIVEYRDTLSMYHVGRCLESYGK